MSTNLKSSLEADTLDQEGVGAQNVPDLDDKVDVHKSWEQLGCLPGVLKELKGEILGLLMKAIDFYLQKSCSPLRLDELASFPGPEMIINIYKV